MPYKTSLSLFPVLQLILTRDRLALPARQRLIKTARKRGLRVEDLGPALTRIAYLYHRITTTDIPTTRPGFDDLFREPADEFAEFSKKYEVTVKVKKSAPKRRGSRKGPVTKKETKGKSVATDLNPETAEQGDWHPLV